MLFAYINHVHSITGDNGTEFTDHENIAQFVKTAFLFTDPYTSRQKV